MKNHRYNDSGTIITYRRTSKRKDFNRPKNNEDKEDKATEEESKASFVRKSK